MDQKFITGVSPGCWLTARAGFQNKVTNPKAYLDFNNMNILTALTLLRKNSKAVSEQYKGCFIRLPLISILFHYKALEESLMHTDNVYFFPSIVQISFPPSCRARLPSSGHST